MKLDKNKLDLAMANACLNSYELCDKGGIGRPTFAQIKNGKGNPKPATVGKLARALNVKVEDIIMGDAQ